MAIFLLRIPTNTVDHRFAFATNVTVVLVAAAAAVLTYVGSAWNLGPLPRIGCYSYSLYLIHQQIGVWLIGTLKRFGHVSDWVAIASAVALSLGLAALVFHFVEEPAQRWLRDWHARRVALRTALDVLVHA